MISGKFQTSKRYYSVQFVFSEMNTLLGLFKDASRPIWPGIIPGSVNEATKPTRKIIRSYTLTMSRWPRVIWIKLRFVRSWSKLDVSFKNGTDLKDLVGFPHRVPLPFSLTIGMGLMITNWIRINPTSIDWRKTTLSSFQRIIQT